MGLLDGLLGFAGPLIGGLLGYEGQENTNQANAEEAARNREFQSQQAGRAMDFSHDEARYQMAFQESMARNAVQIRQQDLAKAGINPILAGGQGGADVPGGAAGHGASGGGAQATFGNSMLAAGQAASSAASVANQMKDLDLKDAEINLRGAQSTQALSSSGQLDAVRDSVRQEMQSFDDRWQLTRSQDVTERARARNVSQDTELKIAHKFESMGRLQNLQPAEREKLVAQAKKYVAEARLLGLKVPEGIREASFWSDSDVADRAISVRHAGEPSKLGSRIFQDVGDAPGRLLEMFRRNRSFTNAKDAELGGR